MKRTLLTSTLAVSLSGLLVSMPIIAAAEDIDIFTGGSGGSSVNPRILIVLDNTSNWAAQNQQWPGGLQQGQSEARAIKNLLPTLDSTVNLGLMEFVTAGNANDNGGFIRSAIRPLTDTAKASLGSQLDTIFNHINATDEKRNSHTPYGNLMYDVYNYFAGANSYSPGGVLASLADGDGYTNPYTTFRSPLSADNTCGKSFVIFIGNPNQSGPKFDDAPNTAALNQLNGNTDANGAIIPVKQLGLPDFTTQNTTTTTNVGTTSACYPDALSAIAGKTEFETQCKTFTQDCAIGAPTANVNPIACPAGSLSYSVVQTVTHPATTAPGVPVQGTITTQYGKTNGYYASASAVPASDHGDTLTCPATTTSSGNNTSTTTSYSCTFSVGAADGTATPTTLSSYAKQDNYGKGVGCYTGVGTAAGNWNPASTTDFGTLTCPANNTCTYSGAVSSNAGGCNGNSYRQVNVTQTATPKLRYNLTMTVTPTTVSNTTTPPYSTTSVLGQTAQCYSSPPQAATGDYAASCTGDNITCTYNNTPTSTTLASCPPGTSAYKVDGTNIVLVDVPTGTTTTDTGPLNADEWARLLHDRGVPVAGSSVRSSVTTYTIDVYNKQPNATHTSLLMSMAQVGGGKYFAAKNEDAILSALKQILVEIQAVNTTFASTSLPVSATNRSQNENQVFIGMFRPDARARPRWFGNLKRYKLISANGNVELGDANGNIATNNVTGFVTPCAASYWTTDSGSYWSGLGVDPDPAGTCGIANLSKYSDLPDGPQVEKGGTAEVLRMGNVGGAAGSNEALNRRMLTVSGTSLTDFTAASSGLSQDLVNFLRGSDVNNEKDGPGTTRPSIHGDVIHSRPLPVNYGGTTKVRVYYGANDGALHAIDAATGVEKWSLVAPEFFSRLGRLKDNSPQVSYPSLASGITPTPQPKDYFFDGSLGLFQNTDNSKVWIFPSMRRGGRMLYGIDVTQPDSPTLKWRAGCPNLGDDTGCTAGMSGIGQTWSTPNVAFIKGYSTTSPVIVVGGGYDSCEDADTASPSCSGRKGGFVFVLDADTGTLLRAFTTDRAVAADVPMVDVNNDGMPDFAFPVDTGGNIYRIDFVNATGGYMPLTSDGWTVRKVAYASGGRKFLYAPALFATAGKVYVAVGSGDREHPLQSQYPYNNVLNRFYVYLDDLAAPTGTPAISLDGLSDYTSSNSCSTAQIVPGSTSRGWYMNLNQYGKGEQTVTSALITGGMAVFSTNRPIPPDAASCSTTLGEARGYWVNLFNGSGGLGGTAACGTPRSSVFVGGGLPPSPTKASGVDVSGNIVTVVFGAAKETASVSIAPTRPRPAISYKRKRVYKATSGD